MKIPTAYKWLEGAGVLPRTISLGLDLYGVAEVVGKGSSATIMEWRNELNQAGVKIDGYSDDDIPWCGLFAAIVCYRRKSNAAEIPKSPLWARNWASYGVKSDKASLGDVLVFSRSSGGHVGFYIAEDDDAYHVLGGNQSNRVFIARISKDRCIAVRRPPYTARPISVKPYRVAIAGKLSTNEA